MALSKEDKKRFLPDLLPESTIVEVIRRDKDGNVVMKIMSHGEFKKMDKQKGFHYQEFQKGFSQFLILKNK